MSAAQTRRRFHALRRITAVEGGSLASWHRELGAVAVEELEEVASFLEDRSRRELEKRRRAFAPILRRWQETGVLALD